MIYDNLDDILENVLNKIKCNKNIIFLLQGTLGIGKTTLIKEIIKKINRNLKATSPTYSIMHQYGDNIFHYDLYMKDIEYALEIGILDLLSTDGLHFVEWGNKILFNILKQAGLCVYIISITDNFHKSPFRLYEIIEE